MSDEHGKRSVAILAGDRSITIYVQVRSGDTLLTTATRDA
jgi:hypothetical protein